MSEKKAAPVRSIERAIAILKAFSVETPEMGIGQLSRRLNLPKSTVFRLLSTLEAGGLVSQNSQTSTYRLGLALVALANNVLGYADLRRIAAPHLRQLSESLKETVNLTILDGSDAVNLDQYTSPNHLVMRVGWVGRRMPAHTVSSGKAMLAFLPPAVISSLLQSELEPLTPHTITDRDRFQSELVQVRRQGYATAFEELEEGLHAVSAPIFDHQSGVVAAVSISGPAYRLDPECIQKIAPVLLCVAGQISHELGYPHDRSPSSRVR